MCNRVAGGYQPPQLVISLLVKVVEEGKAALGSPLQNPIGSVL